MQYFIFTEIVCLCNVFWFWMLLYQCCGVQRQTARGNFWKSGFKYLSYPSLLSLMCWVGKSQPIAEITSTPTGVVDSVSSHRNPFATLSTNSPNLGRQQVTLVKSKGIEETIKPGYVEKKTPQHGKVKRYASFIESPCVWIMLENWYNKTAVGYVRRKIKEYMACEFEQVRFSHCYRGQGGAFWSSG